MMHVYNVRDCAGGRRALFAAAFPLNGRLYGGVEIGDELNDVNSGRRELQLQCTQPDGSDSFYFQNKIIGKDLHSWISRSNDLMRRYYRDDIAAPPPSNQEAPFLLRSRL